MKLLLVEDEEELSAIISKGLRKSGYAIDKTYDGEAALYLYDHIYFIKKKINELGYKAD